VGASGAIAGVLGAYAAAFPRARVITLLPLFPFFQVVACPRCWCWDSGSWCSSRAARWCWRCGASGGVAVWGARRRFVFGAVVMLILRGGRRVERRGGAYAE